MEIELKTNDICFYSSANIGISRQLLQMKRKTESNVFQLQLIKCS